jgi:hypothetical protein
MQTNTSTLLIKRVKKHVVMAATLQTLRTATLAIPPAQLAPPGPPMTVFLVPLGIFFTFRMTAARPHARLKAFICQFLLPAAFVSQAA